MLTTLEEKLLRNVTSEVLSSSPRRTLPLWLQAENKVDIVTIVVDVVIVTSVKDSRGC
jgi:hypothetical protein